jgi:predicted O-linked N-acetylglucosamine transferase (SPINDLY family)
MKNGFLYDKNETSKTKPNKNKIYICGCVRNCEKYLSFVFSNIKKLTELFDEYKILIAYDESYDNTYNILLEYKKQFSTLEILSSNKQLTCHRTENISNARNTILDYIKKEDNPEYKQFIMMDFDDINAGKMNIEVLKKYLFNEKYEWESLSFNRNFYYDIWALSIDKYIFSCWHWDNNPNIQFSSSDIVKRTHDYIVDKIKSITTEELLECYSAFNGFAIYKKSSFMNCRYEFDINKNIQIIPKGLLKENKELLKREYYINFIEDCEHRFFHLSSVIGNKSKIRISPLILFEEFEEINNDNIKSVIHETISIGGENPYHKERTDTSIYSKNPVIPRNFLNIYEEIKRNPTSRYQLVNQMITEGMNIYSTTENPYLKEQVLLRLIEIVPDEPGFYYYMGYTFKDIEQDRALMYYKQSYDINPHNIENMIDLCNILYEKEESKIIIEMNKMTPFNNELLNDIRFLTVFCQCKCESRYFKDILEYYLKIIHSQEFQMIPKTEKEKDWIYSNHLNIGHVYCIHGDVDKSIEYTEKAMEIAMNYNMNHEKKISALQNLLCFYDYSYFENTKEKYLKINDLIPNKYNYSFKHLRSQMQCDCSTRIKKSKIKIGYLSSDFVNHVISNFIYPIIKNHNTELFEIHLFVNNKTIFKQYADLDIKKHIIWNVSDQEVANIINKEEIDILIDLNGHTNDSRLEIFGLNPAPIQMTYLGFPNTTGLKSIQYRITDGIADSEDTTQFFTEKLLRLPKCFLLFDSINQTNPVIPRKTQNTIILGSLNKENKNSSNVLETWKKILKECPNTKLLIKLEAHDDNISRMEYYTKKLEVDKSRLLLLNKLENNDGYNRLFTMIDILLDTFPYSGTTTTCNALYNSIPLVTFYKKNIHSHNVSSSLLINSGIPELVAYSEEEYINIVKHLIANPSKIDEYKNNIHDKFMKLMEPKSFMESYEYLLKNQYDIYYENKEVIINTNEEKIEIIF